MYATNRKYVQAITKLILSGLMNCVVNYHKKKYVPYTDFFNKAIKISFIYLHRSYLVFKVVINLLSASVFGGSFD